MIIAISGKINSGKDLIGEIILYLTDRYYHSKVGGEASFENWRASNIHSSGYDIGHKSMYEVNNTDHFVIKKFADKLKDIVCILLGCTREQLEDREFKEKELGEEWWKWKVDVIRGRADSPHPKQYILPYIDNTGTDHHITIDQTVDIVSKKEVIKLTPRLLLQLLGTDCGRNIIHPNIWVNALMSEYIKTYPPEGKGNMKVAIMPRKYYPNWIITDTRFPNELKAVKDKGGITIRVNREPEGKWIDKQEWDLHTKGIVPHESETALYDAEFDYEINNDSSIEELIEKVREILVKQKLL